MSIPLISSALWLLCMFAAVTHAAQPLPQRTEVIWLLPAMLVALLLTRWVTPQAGWVGVLIALSAIWQLLRRPSLRSLLIVSGFYSGLAAAIYIEQGMPAWLAVLLAVAVLLVCIYCSNNVASQPGFVSARIRFQALIGLAWVAPCIAAVPSVLSGWQSAQNLNRTIETAAGSSVPAWTWQFAVGALLLGLLRGLWVRK
ncbi:MAG: hypothetical protein QM808_15045 [Steroidobacteraceae bacterium]